MIKIVAAVRRKPGMLVSEYRDHTLNTHAALMRAKPLTIRRYVQNHTLDSCFGAASDPQHLTMMPRDSVTELWFDDPASMAATFSDPYTAEVMGPDAKTFADEPSTIAMLTAEVEAVEGAPGAGERRKALWFLKSGEGVHPADFEARWSAAERSAADASGRVRRSVRSRHLPPPPGEAAASKDRDYFGGQAMIRYDGLQSIWVDAATAAGDMRAFESAFAAAMGDAFDPSRSFWLLTEEIEIYPGG